MLIANVDTSTIANHLWTIHLKRGSQRGNDVTIWLATTLSCQTE